MTSTTPSSSSSGLGLSSAFGFFKWRDRPLSEILAKGFLNSFVITLSITVFLVFILGSYDVFRNVEKNKCGMTYMYEYPEYIRIKLGTDMDKKYAKYGLYAYAEGTEVRDAWRHKFTGIPVLFIPGNAGSYKQVRSLASVALRKWLHSRTPFHFDFFTVDFNEELSGLYGYVLHDQREYLSAAVERIRSFYEEYHNVILIGHSMGGIVSKTLKGREEPLSNMIITLATPHSRPVMIFDPEVDLFYFHLSRNWTLGGEKLKKDVTLISVAGGDRDFLVQEGYTKWGHHFNLHTTTTGVPGVWASTDHRCIVWCRELVLAIVRMFFDMVEYKQPNGYYALTQNMELRDKIIQYHLNKKTSGKFYYGAHKDVELGRPPGSTWIESLETKYCSPTSRSTTYLMFPKELIKQQMRGDPEDYRVLILTTNTEAKNWVFGCTSQSITNIVRYCSQADNLSPLGEIIPHFRRRRKVIHLKYSDVVKYTHLVVKMEPLNIKSCVNLEVYDDTERSTTLNTKFETENKIFYNLSLPLASGVFSKMFSWNIIAHTGNASCKESHNSLASFHHGNFKIHKYPRNETLVARFSDWNASAANVQLYLEPSCKYTVQVRLASLETAGQIFRTYLRFLPSFMGSIVLMSLYFQRDGSNWSNFHRVLISNAYHLTIVPGFVVSILLSTVPNDWPHMMDGPEYFIILPMFCYLVAFAIVAIIATGTWYIVIASGNAVHAVFLKMLTTRFANWTNLRMPIPNVTNLPEHVADIAFDFTFGKFPIIISVFLISLTLTTCGGFGLLATFCFSIVKLFKMYEDLLGDLWRARIQDVADGLSPLNFQFSCCMIWFFLTGVNIPSLLHWVKSFLQEGGSQWDLSMYLCLMVLPTVSVLWQDHIPKFNPTLWKLHRYIFYIMGISIVVWGTFRLYITAFILTVVLITTAMCQLISAIIKVPEEEESLRESEATNVDEDASASSEAEVEDELETSDKEEKGKERISSKPLTDQKSFNKGPSVDQPNELLSNKLKDEIEDDISDYEKLENEEDEEEESLSPQNSPDKKMEEDLRLIRTSKSKSVSFERSPSPPKRESQSHEASSSVSLSQSRSPRSSSSSSSPRDVNAEQEESEGTRVLEPRNVSEEAEVDDDDEGSDDISKSSSELEPNEAIDSAQGPLEDNETEALLQDEETINRSSRSRSKTNSPDKDSIDKK